MPLPSDEKLVHDSQEVVNTLHKLFGEHPGIRPVENIQFSIRLKSELIVQPTERES